MAEELLKPIVIKKVKKVSGGGHSGGSWKIAYADFVTAMMAFFLLMWLLGTLTQAKLEGISAYFKTPLMTALGGPAVASSDSLIKSSGSKDLAKKQLQSKPVDKPKPDAKVKAVDIEDVKRALEKAEAKKLEDLKAKIEQAIDASPTLINFKKQLLLDITTEGLRIQIVDEKNRPMFASSKAELQPYAKQILREIGLMLNGVSNRISLSGHTDTVPYPSGEKYYSNWELSADRANASRRELVAGGMDETKVFRIVGLASASLFDKENPLNPSNRRISIIVMNKKAEENAMKDDAVAIRVPSDASRVEVGSAIQSP